MPPDSSTGGYLQPYSTPVVSEDAALADFLHDVFAGILGLSGDLVRPRWQPNPPPTPEPDVDWFAFGVTAKRNDYEPAFDQVERPTDEDPDATAARMTRHAQVEILCSAYGPNSSGASALLTDGLYLSQNREALYSAGIGLGRVSDPFHVPELVNENWLDRWDFTVTLGMAVVREYPVLHFLAAAGTIQGNRGTTIVPVDFSVGE